MGIMEKLRAELVDIIEWVDDSRHTLVWRFPRFHNQIKHGAHLIVRPGQMAVFVHRGKIADVFEPGHHELETRNLPILSTIAGWKHGFDSPFKAECYFVRTTQVPDLKWGTPNPIMMRDADFGPIRIRAFGTYTLRATEPRALLEHLVGTDGSFETEEVTELLRAVIHSAFAQLVAESDIAVLDLARNYKELSDGLRAAVVERVDDEYGLDIPQLFIVNISLPAEVEKALDARTSMGVLGDMGQYQAYQLAQATPVAAANPAGGLAGAGLGLGMGMALAGQMGPMAGGARSQAPAAAAPPAPPAAAWHIVENGQSLGPFGGPQISQLVTSGRLRADTLVWMAGMSGWIPAGQVPALSSLFATTPPPVPGA